MSAPLTHQQIDSIEGALTCACGGVEDDITYCDENGEQTYDDDGEVVQTHVRCVLCDGGCEVEEIRRWESGDDDTDWRMVG